MLCRNPLLPRSRQHVVIQQTRATHRSDWSARAHARVQSPVHGSPIGDGTIACFLLGYQNLIHALRKYSAEPTGEPWWETDPPPARGCFAVAAEAAVYSRQQNFSCPDGHSIMDTLGSVLGSKVVVDHPNPFSHTPLSSQLQLAPLLSFEIAIPLAHSPSPHDAAPKAKIRTFTTVNAIFFQVLPKPPQLR